MHFFQFWAWFWALFYCIIPLFLGSQKVCLRFLKSDFKLGILMFLAFVASFWVDILNWKAPFLMKKHRQWNWRHFSREAFRNLRGKVLKENSVSGRSWSSAKLFIMENYTGNANGDVPVKVENMWHFCFLWVQDAHMLFSIVFFTKSIFILWR